MSPADELRTAAEKLRALAATAAPGPWTATRWHSDTCRADCDDPTCFMLLVSTPTGLLGDADVDRDGVFAIERSVHEQGEADAGYIAAMHPGVGKVLTAWLDYEADLMGPGSERRGRTTHALAVARAINGTQP